MWPLDTKPKEKTKNAPRNVKKKSEHNVKANADDNDSIYTSIK